MRGVLTCPGFIHVPGDLLMILEVIGTMGGVGM